MCVVFAVVCVYSGNVPGLSSFKKAKDVPAKTFPAPVRSLHGDEDGDVNATGFECYGGMTYDEQYEQDVIGPFQVLTQRKYMLTIYGCAVGSEGDPICLRPEYYWMIPVYVVGLLYMFAGLAIICDEFFVPALEVFTGEDHGLGLAEDVAGATFMAAGGSMPELFTSFIGTFNESDIGFAAIIGSAVFNVLFVIAVCTLASDEPLQLTWWPLFRDVMWYLLSLALVAFVFKASSPSEIEHWEAALLLCCYGSYVVFMKFNQKIYAFVTRKAKPLPGGDETSKEMENQDVPLKDADTATAEQEAALEANFVKPSTFRVGIFQLLTQNASVSETAGIHAVTKIKGNLLETFQKFDKDKNNHLGEEEVMSMLADFGLKDQGPAIQKQLKDIEPRTGTGDITFEAFAKWYIASEIRVAVEVHNVFKKFDTDSSGTIDRNEVKLLLAGLGHKPSDEDVTTALEQMRGSGDESGASDSDAVRPVSPSNDGAEEGITLPQFEKWYQQSMFWQQLHQKHVNQSSVEDGGGFNISWPEGAQGSQVAWYVFTYPIAAMMYVTMPDVRRDPDAPGVFRMAIREFCCSLAWIAFLSLCLYDWLVVVCNTIGFPPEVAAVTVLAGGTSIPDLLSSYVVAREGKGDMAVSSSIGSNIFDVTVGLPLPWLAFNLINGRRVVVGSNSLFSSILILILMLIGVITTVMAMKWKMTKGLGAVMMLLYIIFIVQQLLQDFDVFSYGI